MIRKTHLSLKLRQPMKIKCFIAAFKDHGNILEHFLFRFRLNKLVRLL